MGGHYKPTMGFDLLAVRTENVPLYVDLDVDYDTSSSFVLTRLHGWSAFYMLVDCLGVPRVDVGKYNSEDEPWIISVENLEMALEQLQKCQDGGIFPSDFIPFVEKCLANLDELDCIALFWSF